MSALMIAALAAALLVVVIFVFALCRAAVTPKDIEEAWRRGNEDGERSNDERRS